MTEHNEPCCVGTVKQGELQGTIKQLGDLQTYVTGPTTAGVPAVLLLPDAFGFGIPNNQLYADHLARHGFLVAVPDFFHGDPWSKDADFSNFMPWKAKHDVDRQMKELNVMLEEFHLLYKPKSVCCIGFCWGGRHSTLFAGTNKVSAAVVAHGSFVTQDIVEDAKKPILFLFADQDRQITEEVRHTFEDIISKKSFPTKGKFYPGCEHGWALRGDDSDPKIREGAADAFSEAVSWFKAHG